MRVKILRALTALACASGLVLVNVPPAQAVPVPSGFCYAVPSHSPLPPVYTGDSASSVYDWVEWKISETPTTRRFTADVPIASDLIGDDWVPQGLARVSNWAGGTEDLFLISAYLDENHNKVPDARASAIFGVVANGTRAGLSLGRMLIESGHVGGIAVVGNFVYVGSEDEIRIFERSTVASVLKDPNIDYVFHPIRRQPTSWTVGFLGTGVGKLWGGEFDKDNPTTVMAFSTDPTTGVLSYDYQYVAPARTQGVYVTDDRIIFATSYYRDQPSNIWIMERGQQQITDDSKSACFQAPSMLEGITVLGDKLYLNYESAAHTYQNYDNDGDGVRDGFPRNRVENLHVAPLSWVEGLYTNFRNYD